MKINITSSIQLTPALEAYAESKLGVLAKVMKHFEDGADVQVWLALGMGKHHKKGDIFTAAIEARLPKKTLHAEAEAESVRTAIDQARDMVRTEVEKYKDKLLPKRGKE